MPNKRGQNEGSFDQMENGTWRGRITVGVGTQGKQKRKSFYGKTRKEVQLKVTQALNQINTGTYIETTNMTVAQWLDIWFTEYILPSVKHATHVNYDGIIHKHINPHLGHIKLADLRTDTIQSFYNAKSLNGRADGRGGLSPKSVKNIHSMLHKALDQALDNGLIAKNPSNAISLPKPKKTREMRVLTPDEHRQLVANSYDHDHGLVIRLALETGLRIGELLGLQWSDIDFTDSSLTIKRTINRLKSFDPNSTTKTVVVVSEPKTKNSLRTIPLSSTMLAELTQHRQAQERIIKQAYIFINSNQNPFEARRMQKIFKDILHWAELKDINFHALRHTFATRALEANVPAKVVSEMLGHANISITLDTYSHVSLDSKRTALEQMNNYINSNSDFG